MKTIEIPFGKGSQTLSLPENRLRAVLKPSHGGEKREDERELVERALRQPIGSCRLAELAQNKQRVLVIASDHTRPVPSQIIMPPLLAEIRTGAPSAEIVILIATGMHRPTTEQELRQKFGDEIVAHERVVVHEAVKEEDMVTLGTLPSGGELRVNKWVRWADLIVSEGFIEPHFFAGFSGGRKSILPGVASKTTVLYNHNAQFIKDPRASQGCLEGNPIHNDMLYAAKTAGLRFIVNVVLDADKRVIAAFAGDPEKAHAEGCAYSERLTRVVPVEADIVVTSNGGYPLDQNVYQSVKGMTAAEACVRKGGAIILCAALGDGHGGEAFYRWFAERACAADVTRDIENVPSSQTYMDQWEAQILARVMARATCFFVTGQENRELIESMHMRWAPDVNTAVAEATKLLGENASVTVIPDGVGVIVNRG